MADDLKECPQCAEMIKRKAVKCRYCGHTFDDAPAEPAAQPIPAVAARPKAAPVTSFDEEIAEFENEQKKGRKVGKFFLFLLLFIGFGAAGWFLEKNGYIDMAFYRITGGRYTADVSLLDGLTPVGLREGRLSADMAARGAAARIDLVREITREAVIRGGSGRTEGKPHKITRRYVDINALKTMAGFEPGNPDNAYNLGTAYLLNFEYARAVEQLVKAVAVLPWDYEGYANLAAAYYRDGAYDQAEREARKALRINPSVPQAVNIVGLCHLRQNRRTEALQTFQRLAEDHPGFADAYVNMGNIYRAQDNLNMAAEKYRKAVSLNAGHGAASSNLAAVKFETGGYDQALKYWQTALDNVGGIEDGAILRIEKNIRIVKNKLL